MNEEEFQALARHHTPEALRTLAKIARDPIGADRDRARKALQQRLEQIGGQISPDLRRELEDAVHGK